MFRFIYALINSIIPFSVCLFNFLKINKIALKIFDYLGREVSSIFFKFKIFFSFKIFGIGLSRTGTKSLSAALRELGYKVKHYPPTQYFYEIIDEFEALTDIPIAVNYKALDRKYPHSKFILTIRDLPSWLKSCEKHVLNTSLSKKWQIDLRIKCYGTKIWDINKYRSTYYNHLKDVTEYFKERDKDFLVLNIIDGEGYEKLCAFLGKPVIYKKFPNIKE